VSEPTACDLGVIEHSLSDLADELEASGYHAVVLRELQEETGYTGEHARLIGECLANPAIMNNRVHTILVENCRRTHEVQLDAGEDLSTRLIPADDLPRLVKEQKIRHSTIVAALHYFVLEK